VRPCEGPKRLYCRLPVKSSIRTLFQHPPPVAWRLFLALDRRFCSPGRLCRGWPSTQDVRRLSAPSYPLRRSVGRLERARVQLAFPHSCIGCWCFVAGSRCTSDSRLPAAGPCLQSCAGIGPCLFTVRPCGCEGKLVQAPVILVQSSSAIFTPCRGARSYRRTAVIAVLSIRNLRARAVQSGPVSWVPTVSASPPATARESPVKRGQNVGGDRASSNPKTTPLLL